MKPQFERFDDNNLKHCDAGDLYIEDGIWSFDAYDEPGSDAWMISQGFREMTPEESLDTARFFVCADERIQNAEVTDDGILLYLDGEHSFLSPMSLYPTLQKMSIAERNCFSIAPQGIHWLEMDYDLSLEGMLKGRPEFVKKPELDLTSGHSI